MVLSILTLKRAKPRPRIMYIDLDLHFGDAVSEAFANPSLQATSNPSTLTLSIHHAEPGFFPATPKSALTSPDTIDPYTLSIPLCRGASSETYTRVWKEAVEPIKEAFRPDFVVVQCGADGLAGDPCATFNWSIDLAQEGSMGWCVHRALQWGSKTLLLGGGKAFRPAFLSASPTK